jgi:hypothetical protein
MRHTTLLLLGLLILLPPAASHGQPSFTVEQLQGKAKVQRPPKRTWSSVTSDEKLLDNDLVETFFKTRLLMGYGDKSAVVLGSNSKSLLNLQTEEGDDATRIDLNLTLFGGGLLVNNAGRGRVEIYTANGVAVVDSGTVSAVVEPKTGHTGFQVLGGSAQVRNVAQKKSKRLNAGQTTVILPGREPTAGLHLTYKHVSVLKHFFGEDYIEHEMEVSGIQPTAESAARDRVSLSGNLGDNARTPLGAGTYKALFSLDKIYGSILESRGSRARRYTPVSPPPPEGAGKITAGAGFATAVAAGEVFPAFTVSAALSLPIVGIGLRLPIAKDVEGMSLHFGGAGGILDKLDFLRFGSIDQGRYLYAGAIHDLTLGSGIAVDDFTNVNPYSIYRATGLYGRFESWLFDAEAFMADLTNFKLGGAHLAFKPGGARLGAGYYFDLNQNEPLVGAGQERFVKQPSREPMTITSGTEEGRNMQIVELGLDVDLIDREDLGTRLSFAFAQKLGKRTLGSPRIPPVPLDMSADTPTVTGADSAYFDSLSEESTDEGMLDGSVFRGPTITVAFSRMRIGFGCLFEHGRLTRGMLDENYLTNRLREYTVDDTTYLWPLTDILSSSRRTNGFELFYGISFIPGTALDLAFRIDYFSHRVFADTSFTAGATPDNNFDLSLSFALDERAVPAISHAVVYLRHSNGTYFPPTGGFFASWGFETGLDVLTAPLMWELAIDAGLKFYYLDLSDTEGAVGRLNNQLDEGDRVFEVRFGVRRGFL